MEEVAKLSSGFESNDTVTISLDASEKQFFVSAALLCNASPYFEKALNGGFKESITKTLRLPDCEEQVFRMFLYWLCNNKLPDFGADCGEKDYLSLVRIWNFSKVFLLPKLRNDTTRCLLSALGRAEDLHPSVVSYVFEHFDPDSVMRESVVREVVGDWREGGGAYGSHDKMNELAAIPDFMMRFAETLWETRDIPLEHLQPCMAYRAGSTEEYMISE